MVQDNAHENLHDNYRTTLKLIFIMLSFSALFLIPLWRPLEPTRPSAPAVGGKSATESSPVGALTQVLPVEGVSAVLN